MTNEKEFYTSESINNMKFKKGKDNDTCPSIVVRSKLK